MSCGVGRRCCSDLALLWLWYRLAAIALIRPLAWEPLCAAGVALKGQKKKKKRIIMGLPHRCKSACRQYQYLLAILICHYIIVTVIIIAVWLWRSPRFFQAGVGNQEGARNTCLCWERRRWKVSPGQERCTSGPSPGETPAHLSSAASAHLTGG